MGIIGGAPLAYQRTPSAGPHPILRLASRRSVLALVQLRQVESALKASVPDIDLLEVLLTTTGDDGSLPLSVGDEVGLFTSALEAAVSRNQADAAVHSLKDLPTEPSDLAILAVLERSAPWDVLVTREGHTLEELPRGSRVGTSSPRRAGFLALARPDLELVEIRGNIDTRLAKLDAKQVDALVLAEAGLVRLGVARAWQRLGPEPLLPAAGQGAIAVQGRADHPLAQAVRRIDHRPTHRAVEAERACLQALGGGCNLPLGVWATVQGRRLQIRGSLLEGGHVGSASAEGDLDAAQALGEQLALALRRALGSS